MKIPLFVFSLLSVLSRPSTTNNSWRMWRIRSTNGLLLLVFLTPMLFMVAASEKCEVEDIQVIPNETTFVYKLTYKDDSCSNNGDLNVTMKTCPDEQTTQEIWGEGETFACQKGSWKATLGKIESACFSCRPIFTLRFTVEELNIVINHVRPSVSSWKVRIYKTKTERNYLTCQDHKISDMKKRFVKTALQPNISRTKITLKHHFEEACYCFELVPVSDMNLMHEWFTTHNCKPQREDSAPPPYVPSMGILPKTYVAMGVLVGIVCLVAILIKVILAKPQLLSWLLGVASPAKSRRPSNTRLMPQRVEVLLLYADDVSGSEHLAKLKTRLGYKFTVHDLFGRYDVKRQADSCGWMEEKLRPDSGVKLLLVESAGMMDLINSLPQSCSDDPGTARATHESCKLLILALRTIISTNLTRDYSTVFVVRFSDEMEEITDHRVVQMRRYKFPDHIRELEENMMRNQMLAEV